MQVTGKKSPPSSVLAISSSIGIGALIGLLGVQYSKISLGFRVPRWQFSACDRNFDLDAELQKQNIPQAPSLPPSQ